MGTSNTATDNKMTIAGSSTASLVGGVMASTIGHRALRGARRVSSGGVQGLGA